MSFLKKVFSTSNAANSGIALPEELASEGAGGIDLEAVFRGWSAEERLSICRSLPISQLDFSPSGAKDPMGWARFICFAVARYLASEASLRDCADIVIPRIASRIAGCQLLQEEMGHDLGQFAAQLDSVGYFYEAVECFRTLRDATVIGRVKRDECSFYMFICMFNLARSTKSRADIQLALSHSEALPLDWRQKADKMIIDLTKMVP